MYGGEDGRGNRTAPIVAVVATMAATVAAVEKVLELMIVDYP